MVQVIGFDLLIYFKDFKRCSILLQYLSPLKSHVVHLLNYCIQ